jgi:hypothetical protein
MPTVPNGWHDDGKTLTAPNGFKCVLGFRGHILNNPWDPNNWPVENETYPNPLELSNPSLGGGTRQRFRLGTTLEYTKDRGVFVAYSGLELIALEQKVAQLEQQLQSNPAPTPPPTPTIPANVLADAKAVVDAVDKLKQDAGL